MAEKKITVPNFDPNSVQAVRIADLRVDPSYQRGIKRHHKKIAKTWNPDAAGFLHVNIRPDYSQWIVDGQQRAEAMKLLGITSWMAHVTTLPGPEEEAKLYAILNGGYGTRVGVGERDLFKSLVAAKDPNTLKTIAAVEAGGLRLRLHVTKGLKWPHLNSTRLARRICHAYGPEVLTRLCKVIAQSWPHADEAMDSYIFMGGGMFLTEFPNLREDVTITAFRRKPVTWVMQSAKARTHNHNIAAGVRDVLIEVYNYNRKEKHRIALQRPGKERDDMTMEEMLPDNPAEAAVAAALATA